MKKWLLRFLGFCLLLIPATLFFFAGTDTGLRCLIQLCKPLTANILTIGSASGSLFGTLHLRDIRYADGIDTVLIDSLNLTWNPSQLLNRHIHILNIRGAGVQVLLGKSSGETILSAFSLPGILSIDDVSAETMTIFSDQEEVWSLRTGTIKNLSYRGQTLTVEELSLANKTITIQAKGQLLTSNDYPLQGTLESHVRPVGYEPIIARGTVDGPLNTLKIEADFQNPFPAHLSGRLNNLLGSTNWQARLESPEVALTKIHQDWPEQRFTKVVIEGQGTLGDYALQVNSQAGLPQLKELGGLSAELQGNADGIRISTLHLTQGKTELSAKGNLAWNPALSWQAEVNGSHLNPSLFLADWPGDFTVNLTTSGHVAPHGLAASLHVPALQGTLRGFPLAGNGEIHLQGNQLHIPQMVLKSGNSSLRINGQAAETIDFSLQLESNNLAELWPGARGMVIAHGHVTGKPDKPQLDFKCTGNNIAVDGDGAQKLTMEAKGSLARDGVLDASVRAERVQLGRITMNLSRLQLKGSLLDHRLEFEGQGSEFSTGFTLQGNFNDTLWMGTLSQSHFTSDRLGDWRQRQHTPLTLSTERAEIKSFCLASSATTALCMNGSWQGSDGTWQMHGTVNSLPLDLLQTVSTHNWPLEGRLNADIDLTGQQSRILSGKLSSNSNGMSLHIPLADGGTHQVIWRKNTLLATYAENRLQAVLDNELSDNSMVHADWALANFHFSPENILSTPMNGSIQFRIHDLSPLTVLTDQKIYLSGALHGQFTMNGTPGTPMLNGQMELVNGQAEIPPLGITLAPLLLKVTGNAKGAQLLATAHSGKGYLRAESLLQFSRLRSGPHLIHLTGDGFKAAHLPGLDLDVSPDLTFLYGKQQTEVHGTLIIPQARITSIDFHNATAPSDDMVVIDEEETSAATPTVPLLTNITVIAGKDVHINAYGLRGNIAGKLAIKGQPSRPLIGNGTLSVQDGSFTVYGRQLKIDLGRLLFTGGPLTNPGIELRSERKGEKVTTGVIVDGFLQRPEIHFYSSPAMEQAAIVSNLLESTALGGETRQETGFIGEAARKIGLGGMVPYLQNVKKLTMIDEIKLETGDEYDSFSLVFGSWLTPDFYVSYGKDLVNESGSFNTRYTLGNGFSFLTETGSSHSGGDIKYEFER